jgi:hypothetical protein
VLKKGQEAGHRDHEQKKTEDNRQPCLPHGTTFRATAAGAL